MSPLRIDFPQNLLFLGCQIVSLSQAAGAGNDGPGTRHRDEMLLQSRIFLIAE
jgi:hypothetical protein